MATKRDQVYVDIVSETKQAVSGMAKLGAAIGVAFVAYTKIKKLGQDMIRAYGIQEQAEAKLAAAIRATGRQADISVDALVDYAGELQKVTTFGDEATISAAALLQSLANLDEQGLQKILPAIQDLATGMGLDLEMAASLVGKTLGSTTNALSRYGVVIDMTQSKQDKLAELTTILNDKFGGMSQALANSASGSMTQFRNVMGDLLEVGGRVIAESLAPQVKWLTGVATQANEAFKSMMDLNQALLININTAKRGELIRAHAAVEAERDRLLRSQRAGMPTGGRTYKETDALILEYSQTLIDLERRLEELQELTIDTIAPTERAVETWEAVETEVQGVNIQLERNVEYQEQLDQLRKSLQATYDPEERHFERMAYLYDTMAESSKELVVNWDSMLGAINSMDVGKLLVMAGTTIGGPIGAGMVTAGMISQGLDIFGIGPQSFLQGAMGAPTINNVVVQGSVVTERELGRVAYGQGRRDYRGY